MNLDALKLAGAAVRDRESIPVADWAEDLRSRFDRDYASLSAIRSGEASPYGSLSNSSQRGRSDLTGGYSAATAPRCGDCRAIRSPLAAEPCKACGSDQPPDLSAMNPRAARMIGQRAYR